MRVEGTPIKQLRYIGHSQYGGQCPTNQHQLLNFFGDCQKEHNEGGKWLAPTSFPVYLVSIFYFIIIDTMEKHRSTVDLLHFLVHNIPFSISRQTMRDAYQPTRHITVLSVVPPCAPPAMAECSAFLILSFSSAKKRARWSELKASFFCLEKLKIASPYTFAPCKRSHLPLRLGAGLLLARPNGFAADLAISDVLPPNRAQISCSPLCLSTRLAENERNSCDCMRPVSRPFAIVLRP